MNNLPVSTLPEPGRRLAFLEHEIEEGIKDAEAGINRAAIAFHAISREALYLLYVDVDGRTLYPDAKSYLLGRGRELGIARSTCYKHEKTLRIWEWLGYEPEQILEIGGVQPLHHIKALAAKIDRHSGEIEELTPEADRNLPPGETTRERIRAVVDELRSTVEAVGPLPREEIINKFRQDLAGNPQVKPLVRILPSGLVDFGWVDNDGAVGWFSEDVPQTYVKEWYLRKTGAVEYE